MKIGIFFKSVWFECLLHDWKLKLQLISTNDHPLVMMWYWSNMFIVFWPRQYGKNPYLFGLICLYDSQIFPTPPGGSTSRLLVSVCILCETTMISISIFRWYQELKTFLDSHKASWAKWGFGLMSVYYFIQRLCTIARCYYSCQFWYSVSFLHSYFWTHRLRRLVPQPFVRSSVRLVQDLVFDSQLDIDWYN